MTVPADIFHTLIAEHHVALLATLFLLALSATFSSCETSLFSLSAPELNRIRAGKGNLDRALLRLHNNLKQLLPALLFSNMGVNVFIFSLAASIAGSLGERHGAGAAFVYSLANLFLVVFFGEVFPKQLAIASSLTTTRLTVLPVWTIYSVINKPMRVLNAVVTALERIADAHPANKQELREEELKLLVELSRTDGAISEGEYMMIDSIVELPEVRIRDVMVPRIDVILLPADATAADAVFYARRCKYGKLPVADAARDDVSGWVDVRDIFARFGGDPKPSDGTIESHLRPFQYFSEHDRADQVLERIKEGSGADLFAVVDERGAVVGFFAMQDIMDEVLGHFGENGAPPPTEIRETKDGYSISGSLSVREWRDIFNVDSSLPKSATVGGLIVSLLGRLPKPGDKVELANMEMTVVSTWRNRVTEAKLRLVNPTPTDKEQAEKKVSARFYI